MKKIELVARHSLEENKFLTAQFIANFLNIHIYNASQIINKIIDSSKYNLIILGPAIKVVAIDKCEKEDDKIRDMAESGYSVYHICRLLNIDHLLLRGYMRDNDIHVTYKDTVRVSGAQVRKFKATLSMETIREMGL